MLSFFKDQSLSSLFKKLGACLLLNLCFVAHSQVFYTNNPNYLKVKTDQNNLLSSYRYTYPDTSVSQLNNFFQRNFLGNVGLASPNYFLNYGTDDLGFRFFNAPTSNDRFLEKQVEYYRSKGPYADLTGIAGSKLLQIFKLEFTHTFKNRINFTLKFNRYSSQGFYAHQQTYVNNFYLSSNYTTKNNRMGYYFYVLANGNKNQENGGIGDRRLNDSTVALTKALLPVSLTGAVRDNRETKIMINPWMRLKQSGDSLHGLDQYLQLKSKISLSIFKYSDPQDTVGHFYNRYYLDTVRTNDSSNIRQISNEVSYAVMSKDNKFAFSAGYKNEITDIWQESASLFYNNSLTSSIVYRSPFPGADSSKRRNLETRGNAQYIFSGANSGNYKLESNTFLTFDSLQRRLVFFEALYERRNPDYIYNHWISNHFLWNNAYHPQDQLQLKIGIRSGNYLSASVFYNAIHNYLYYDASALPQQYHSYLSNVGVSINYTRLLFKHLGILLNYTFQGTSNKTYMRLPQNSGTAKLFYGASLFKNNLQLQIGGQLQMYQSFSAYGYMPSTQVFYLQNEFKTATYPYLDVFLNARIRPVSFFLKIENVLSGGLAGTNYAFVQGYYQPDRAFRFGISWVFFD